MYTILHTVTVLVRYYSCAAVLYVHIVVDPRDVLGKASATLQEYSSNVTRDTICVKTSSASYNTGLRSARSITHYIVSEHP